MHMIFYFVFPVTVLSRSMRRTTRLPWPLPEASALPSTCTKNSKNNTVYVSMIFSTGKSIGSYSYVYSVAVVVVEPCFAIILSSWEDWSRGNKRVRVAWIDFLLHLLTTVVSFSCCFLSKQIPQLCFAFVLSSNTGKCAKKNFETNTINWTFFIYLQGKTWRVNSAYRKVHNSLFQKIQLHFRTNLSLLLDITQEDKERKQSSSQNSDKPCFSLVWRGTSNSFRSAYPKNEKRKKKNLWGNET